MISMCDFFMCCLINFFFKSYDDIYERDIPVIPNCTLFNLYLTVSNHMIPKQTLQNLNVS